MRSRLNRRLLATVVFVGAAGLVLAGCSGGGGGRRGSAPAMSARPTASSPSSARSPTPRPNCSSSPGPTGRTRTTSTSSTNRPRSSRRRSASLRAGWQPARHRDLPAARSAGRPRVARLHPARARRRRRQRRRDWTEDWAGYGTVDGTLYGAPLMASVKGFIWYSPASLRGERLGGPEDLGRAAGAHRRPSSRRPAQTPWCAGFGSDAATGWPGTDWVEDLVLRQAGPEVYDQWVAHEIPFTDPAIKAAFDSVGEILLNPDYVNAGFGDVVTINTHRRSATPAQALADGDCVLHHQARSSRASSRRRRHRRRRRTATSGPSSPPAEEAGAGAVTGGGEIVGAFSNDADTSKVQEYLSSADWANSRVSLGGVISANKGLDPANASSVILSGGHRDPAGPEHDVPFRRLGPDAGRRRRRNVLEGHGRLDQRHDTDDVLDAIEASWPSE